jgi:hypothetical protein
MDSKTRQELQAFQKRVIRYCRKADEAGNPVTWAQAVAAIEAEDGAK